MVEPDTRYIIRSATLDGRQVAVDWADGHRSRFHPFWLRHQCGCAVCGTPLNAVRGVRLRHLPEDIAPERVESDEERVEIVWSQGGHLSAYPARWLREHCCSDAERARRKHRPVLWTDALQERAPRFDMEECARSDAARLAMLETVRDFGFCVIENAPTERDQASRLIELVGPQRVTHYGTYMLSEKKSVDNVGDITDALDPHCDETYRLSTIGITVFQVLRPSAKGGHSTLVDGFEAVRRLREQTPGDVDLLARVPIAGVRRDPARNSGGRSKWYAARLPAIRLDFDGEVSGVRLNERQIAPLDLPEELIEPVYGALRRLYAILYDRDLRLTFPLAAGQGLIFDNQRVLHGRTAFEHETSSRSVLTSSVDIEEFHSSLRQLGERARGSAAPLRLGQGMIA